MTQFVYLGYEKKSYTNKDGNLVNGYNFYYAYQQDSVTGFKPAMRFDSNRKSLGYFYLSEKQFDKLGLVSIPPLSKVYFTFNMHGGIDNVSIAK